jgi:hypothetical protein
VEVAQGRISGPEEVEVGSSGKDRLPAQRPRREPDDFAQGQTFVAAFNLIGARIMSAKIFLSTVSDEFRAYRGPEVSIP